MLTNEGFDLVAGQDFAIRWATVRRKFGFTDRDDAAVGDVVSEEMGIGTLLFLRRHIKPLFFLFNL